MKLKNSDLEAMVSNPSYQKLFTAKFDDILLVLEIRRQNEDIKPALQAYIGTKQALIERYCDKDLKTGKAVSGPQGQFSFTQVPGSLEKFREKYNELLNKEVEVNIKKIEISTAAISSVSKWSGADISILYPFINIIKATSSAKVKPLKTVSKV